jgi:PAS domain S-box-containing protein
MYQSTLDGRFIELDPILAQMLGYSSAPEMIHSVRDIGAEFYVERQVRPQLIDKLLTLGAVCNFETQVYRKDGGTLWVSEYCRLIRDPDGGIAGFRGAFADISLYKRLLDQQTESNLQVVQELAGLKEAVTGASPRCILIKDGTRIKFMETAKIAFIRADGDYIHVHAANGERIMARDRIGNVERRIGNPQFLRISKSALVNVSYIKEMRSRRRGNYDFLLQSGEQLASGPTYRETVKKLLEGLK